MFPRADRRIFSGNSTVPRAAWRRRKTSRLVLPEDLCKKVGIVEAIVYGWRARAALKNLELQRRKTAIHEEGGRPIISNVAKRFIGFVLRSAT